MQPTKCAVCQATVINTLPPSVPNYLPPEYCLGVPPHSNTSPPLLASVIGGNLQNIDTLQHILCLQQDASNPYGSSFPSIATWTAPLQMPPLQEEQHFPQCLLQLHHYLALCLPYAQDGGSFLSIHDNIGNELAVNLLNQRLERERLVLQFALQQTPHPFRNYGHMYFNNSFECSHNLIAPYQH
jgi:hypothetical protein